MHVVSVVIEHCITVKDGSVLVGCSGACASGGIRGAVDPGKDHHRRIDSPIDLKIINAGVELGINPIIGVGTTRNDSDRSIFTSDAMILGGRLRLITPQSPVGTGLRTALGIMVRPTP